MSAYAPAGAAVSTTGDLARLATALLDGTAPGMAALERNHSPPRSPTPASARSRSRRLRNGQTITWHNGQTGGYTSYFGLDRPSHKAVIVLSDVANNATTTSASDSSPTATRNPANTCAHTRRAHQGCASAGAGPHQEETDEQHRNTAKSR